METQEIPILAGIILAPLNKLELWGEQITGWLIRNAKIITASISCIIALRLTLYFAPKESFQAIWNVVVWNHQAFGAILGSLSISYVVLLLIGYISVICFLWKPASSNLFMIIGQGIWVLVIAYLCSFLGALQVPTFMLIMTYGLFGIIYNMRNDDNVRYIDKLKNIIKIQNDPKKILDTSQESPEENIEKVVKEQENTAIAKKSQPNKLLLNIPKTPSLKRPEKFDNDSLESDVYFKILFYSCLAALLWKHVWIVFLSFIPVTLYVSKKICHVLGITSYVEAQVNYRWGIFMVSSKDSVLRNCQKCLKNEYYKVQKHDKCLFIVSGMASTQTYCPAPYMLTRNSSNEHQNP